jgi:hypothetical protein
LSPTGDVVIAGFPNVLSASLRALAKQSRVTKKAWIAASQELLAMTGIDLDFSALEAHAHGKVVEPLDHLGSRVTFDRAYRPNTCLIAAAFSVTAWLARRTKIGMAMSNSRPMTMRVRLK